MSELYTGAQLSRRAALRGVALFLGAPLIASLESGCASDPQQSGREGRARALHAQWSPPAELERLGAQVVRFSGLIDQYVDEFVRALDKRVQSQRSTRDHAQEGKQEDKRDADSEELQVAQAIHALHLESAIRGEWVDVSGWRLSRVEAAAYALIAMR